MHFTKVIAEKDKKKYKKKLEQIHESIAISGLDTNLVFVTKRFCKMFKCTKKNAKGSLVSSFLHETQPHLKTSSEESLEQEINTLKSSQTGFNNVTWLFKSKNEEIWVQTFLNLINFCDSPHLEFIFKLSTKPVSRQRSGTVQLNGVYKMAKNKSKQSSTTKKKRRSKTIGSSQNMITKEEKIQRKREPNFGSAINNLRNIITELQDFNIIDEFLNEISSLNNFYDQIIKQNQALKESIKGEQENTKIQQEKLQIKLNKMMGSIEQQKQERRRIMNETNNLKQKFKKIQTKINSEKDQLGNISDFIEHGKVQNYQKDNLQNNEKLVEIENEKSISLKNEIIFEKGTNKELQSKKIIKKENV
ncbi:hypothetical protein M0812_26455 [Anaeramoeba flamelloides]|uniref:Uncharacterized protein n=1 Tax=Anaeramoeba flamelloides TaxID=1746091 RepID=A0AAV7YE90_9EUKA|nr:hypothetical protein M0812_26455 [Anaeramoeba flamelloides]